jgi:hypothetical protein
MSLIKITSPTAEIAGKYEPHPEAKALLQPGHTPTQYSAALENGKFSQDHIHFLAHGMPERESVGWACQSSAKVADKLEPADKTALQAAHQWVKNPTPANKATAAAAAAKTNFQGPGAWAAQGAAWSKSPPAPGAPATPQPPGLTGHAVSGSVMLAAAKASGKLPAAPTIPSAPKAPTLPTLPKAPALPGIPKAPAFKAPVPPAPPKIQPPSLAQRAETAKIHQPFIDLGKEIASGKRPCA